MRKLTENEREGIWVTATCPFCGGGLYNGPQGGLMTNVICEHEDTCGARFNMAPMNLPGFDEVVRDTKLPPEQRVKPYKRQKIRMHIRQWRHRLKRDPARC